MSDPAQKNKRLVSRLRSSFNPIVRQTLSTQSDQTQQDDTTQQLPPTSGITQDDALDILDKAIAETEAERVDPGIIHQAIPQAVEEVAQQAEYDGLNPPTVSGTSQKESIASVSPDVGAVEAAQAIQYVEYEPSPEIPPEVESYLQKVENHAEQAPQEIVVADGTLTTPKEHSYPSQPVVVVPITPEIEKKGKRKHPKFSIRWLVEWSHKVMKIFAGKVIYREVEVEE